jgi:hypothetical protein
MSRSVAARIRALPDGEGWGDHSPVPTPGDPMPTIEVRAVAPDLPVHDLLTHPEGGPGAALRALTALTPGSTFDHVSTATWAFPGQQPPEAAFVSTFGGTTVFLSPVPRLTVPPELTTFSVSYQTVSMAYGVDVSGPLFHRLVALSPGVLDYAEGSPLPFEADFDDVTEKSATFSFDDGGFAAAAAQWMFGCDPLEVIWSEEPRTQDRVQLGVVPLHVFTATTPAPAEAAEDRPRRGGLRGLFRRG